MPEDNGEIRYVKDGDVIRLNHQLTGRNLHSHPINAPISSKHWEVSAYGTEQFGDIQDNWKVEIVKDISGIDSNTVKALTSRFRLRHVFLDCVLASRNIALPQWGFRQQEVTCERKSSPSDPHTWWNVEEHYNEACKVYSFIFLISFHTYSIRLVPPAPTSAYKTSFFEDFWHLNVGMWNSNNALIPDPDKDDLLSSGPTEWPMVTVGLRMCGWDNANIKYYLLGNPSVWWSSFISIFVFAFSVAAYIIRQKRQIIDMNTGKKGVPQTFKILMKC